MRSGASRDAFPSGAWERQEAALGNDGEFFPPFLWHNPRMSEPDSFLLVFFAVAVFGAAVARGFFGFGSSALWVASMSWAMPPAVVLPLVFMMEVLASVWLLPGVWREADFKWLRPVVLALLVGTPLGVWALSVLPVDIARVGVYGMITTLAALVWRMGKMSPPPKQKVPNWLAGIFIGAVNGVSALGGLAASVFLLSSGRPAAGIRASLVVLFFVSDIWAILWNGGLGLVGALHFKMLALFALPLTAGIALGSWMFRKFGGGKYRELALALIFAIAFLGLGREIFKIVA